MSETLEISVDAGLLALLPQAVLLLSERLVVRSVNPAAEDMFAQSAAQLQGQPLSSLSFLPESVQRACVRVLESGESVHVLVPALPLPFPQETVCASVQLVAVPGGGVLITLERQDAMQKLLGINSKHEVVRASGVMAAMLAHEVKNPLAGIRGAAQLLQAEVEAEQQPLAALICREVDRIRDLLDQVEVFTAGSPVREPLNIHEVLQYVISIARTGFASHVAFREHYDPSLPLVLAHRELLVQMLLNLVKNAAEALYQVPQPVITLSTAYQSGYRLRVAGAEGAVALPIVVSVEDNGAGVSAEVRDKLFEPFLSSKEQGRGLGLAVVAKLAADLGASVELAEKATPGAKFTLHLPVA